MHPHLTNIPSYCTDFSPPIFPYQTPLLYWCNPTLSRLNPISHLFLQHQTTRLFLAHLDSSSYHKTHTLQHIQYGITHTQLLT